MIDRSDTVDTKSVQLASEIRSAPSDIPVKLELLRDTAVSASAHHDEIVRIPDLRAGYATYQLKSPGFAATVCDIPTDVDTPHVREAVFALYDAIALDRAERRRHALRMLHEDSDQSTIAEA